MEIEYEEEYTESGLLRFIRKFKGIIIAFSIVIGFIVLLFFGMYKMAVPTDYRHFNSQRTAFIENKYKISLDHAKPIRYWESTFAQDSDSFFNFEVSDHRSFIENDFHGKEIIKSYEDPDGSNASYKCRIDERLCFFVKFTKQSGGYKGELRCYRENETQPVQTETQPNLAYGIQ